jgi:hypothetical protein
MGAAHLLRMSSQRLRPLCGAWTMSECVADSVYVSDTLTNRVVRLGLG